MSKKASAVQERPINEALATVPAVSTAMAVRQVSAEDLNDGTEGIDNDDIRIPFLAIAQKTSKVLDPGEGKYNPDIRFMDLYNSQSGEVYGTKIEFIPVVLRKRAVLVGENGKRGEQVPWDDPRVQWVDNKRPEGGIRIYDWAVVLVPSMQLVVLSCSSTSFGAGKDLCGYVRVRKPSYAGKYTLTVQADKNAKGSFGKLAVQPAGSPDDAQFEFARAAYKSIKDKDITAAETDLDDADKAPF